MRSLVAVILVLLLSSCGGGGGNAGSPSAGSGASAVPASLRTDLLFGYYDGCSPYVLEQADHVNLWWTGWCPGAGAWWTFAAGELLAAKAAGIRNAVLMVPSSMVWDANADGEARFQLGKLAATGMLDGFDSIAVYPQDEPDRAGKSEQEVLAATAMYRSIFGSIAQLARAKLAVIYACATGSTPGIAGFDWIGCDDYDRGCGALDEVSKLPITSAQRLLVVPGGADPWQNPPECFLAFAERDARVVAVVPFIWQGVDGHAGIRENATRTAYCKAGKAATRGASSPTC